ncbi:MAG: hypothetical protein K2X72_16240 [Reyranella sp.]|nr:hypothetical protein [Reyranella sp.]
MSQFPQGDLLRTLRIYLGASAILHLAWETLQLPLYTIWSTGTFREIAFAVLHCTVGDLMIASLSLLVALLVVGNLSWPSERFTAVMVTTIVIGVGYTVYSEWVNTTVRKTWEYSSLMPTIPFLGTGLSPLMQWLIVPTIVFSTVRRRYKRQLSHR